MSFLNIMMADAMAMLSTSELAETISYQAHGQSPKEIPAHVFRTEHLELTDPGRREIWISKDATSGIPRVTLGSDRAWIKFSDRDLGLTEMRVSQVISETPVAWMLELKK